MNNDSSTNSHNQIRRKSSHNKNNSVHHHHHRSTNSNSNNNRRKRPSFTTTTTGTTTIKLDRHHHHHHHVGLVRFIVLVIGFGTVGTFLLEGLMNQYSSSSSFPVGYSLSDHPHNNNHHDHHHHHQSFFSSAKRQLSYWGGGDGNSDDSSSSSSNSIAAQVRAQMMSEPQKTTTTTTKTKTSTTTKTTAAKDKVGEEFADIAAQVRAQIEQQGLLNRSIDNNAQGAMSRWFLDEDEEDEEEDFEIPLINDDDQQQKTTTSEKKATTTTKRRRRQNNKSGQSSSPPPPEEGMPDLSLAPPPKELDPNDSFSACLLIKDDNHWLIEWIAFHYHVMPLRRLIVAIDPDSQTTPKRILSRWDNWMNITIWENDDFMKDQPVPNNMIKAYGDNTQLMYHRHRQNTFYIKCLQSFQKEQRPWVHLTDTDEFIAINYASGPLYNLTKHHPIQQPGSVLRFLNHHQQATNDIPNCIFMPRYMFGNKESSKGLVERNVPKRNPILKGKSFLTQRYMFRHPKKMQNGKNLVHLSAIGEHFKPMANVHRVSSSCPTHDEVADVNHIKTTLVKVHHYLGSKEQYFFRMDPRNSGGGGGVAGDNNDNDKKQQIITKGLGTYYQRDSDRYEQLNERAIYSDSGARGWIKGFVDDMGLARAEFLLKDIGKVGVQ